MAYKSVVLANGCFDILHYGHLCHLSAARGMGSELHVAITKDEFVNKGPNKPVFTLEHRIEVMSAITYISRVIASHHPNGIQSLETVKPNKYFKDVEYRDSTHPGFLIEKAFCQQNSIELIFTEEAGYSSSAAIRRMRDVANG